MAKRKSKKSRGRRAATTAGSVGLNVVAGGVAALGIQAIAERSAFVRDNWYAAPLAIGAAGFMIRKRKKWAKASGALLGICGYALVQQYNIKRAGETAGYGDAGALLDPSEQTLLTSNRITAGGAPNVAQMPVAMPVAEPVIPQATEAETLGMF